MPSKKHPLGTGAKKGVIKRPNTSYTSPRAIELQKRRAECLDRRLRGASYRDIATAMHISPALAHEDVCRALKEFVPAEDAKQVLAQELQKLDTMEAAVAPAAAKGDTTAIETNLKIMRMRGRYLNLFADGKGGGVQVNVATGPAKGLEVVFRRSPFLNEPIPGPYDLAGDEYKLLPPPAETIPIAPPEPEPTYRTESEPVEASKPPPRTEFDLTSDEALALGLPDPVPWYKKKLTGRLRRGPRVSGRGRKSR